jgi:acyl-CoA hydrolase
VIKTCPKDEHGCYNFSLATLWHRAIVERAKVVVVEESAGLPHLDGLENAVHESEVDYVIEGDPGGAPEIPNPPPSDVDRVVAKLIAAEIEDGSCLQVGIGAMPNAVCSLLLNSGVRDLGVHTEMLTDGIIDLYRAGIVTGARKTLHPDKIVCSFGVGTRLQYETAHRNPDFFCVAVDHVNLPQLVMQNDRVVAINNTTQMDLQGQAASESAGHRHISGTGGQSQSCGAPAGDDLDLPSRLSRRARARGSPARTDPEGLLVA